MDWSRSELIAVLAVAVAIVGTAAQILTISNPRLRRFMLLVLVITIATAVRLVIVGRSPHSSEPASLPTADSPPQPSPSPEPSKQAVPVKAESGQPPSQPVFQPPPLPILPPKAAAPIQNSIVGDWTSSDLLAADLHFTEDASLQLSVWRVLLVDYHIWHLRPARTSSLVIAASKFAFLVGSFPTKWPSGM
jgi:hypothetical protein